MFSGGTETARTAIGALESDGEEEEEEEGIAENERFIRRYRAVAMKQTHESLF